MLRVTGGDLPRLAAVRIDGENLAVARRTRVEHNLAAIGRPSRRTCQRPGEMRKLHKVRAIRIAAPDFVIPSAGGLKRDMFAVRRILRSFLEFGRSNEFCGWRGLGAGNGKFRAP